MPKPKRKVDKKTQLAKKIDPTQNLALVRESFSGPLPPPALLRGYEAILPGSADRIIKMAEQQAAHRQKLEGKIVDSNIINEKRGMIFGFVLLLILIGTGATLIFRGKNIEGFVALLASPVIPAILYIFTKTKESKDETDKQ